MFGKPFVVEYRPGANSAIGLDAIANAPADGYTIGVATSGMSIHQALAVKKRGGSAAEFGAHIKNEVERFSKIQNISISEE